MTYKEIVVAYLLLPSQTRKIDDVSLLTLTTNFTQKINAI